MAHAWPQADSGALVYGGRGPSAAGTSHSSEKDCGCGASGAIPASSTAPSRSTGAQCGSWESCRTGSASEGTRSCGCRPVSRHRTCAPFLHFLNCHGRLKRGVTVRQASAELRAIQTRLNRQYPKETNPRMGAWAEPLRDALFGDTRRSYGFSWVVLGDSVWDLHPSGSSKTSFRKRCRSKARARHRSFHNAPRQSCNSGYTDRRTTCTLLVAAVCKPRSRSHQRDGLHQNLCRPARTCRPILVRSLGRDPSRKPPPQRARGQPQSRCTPLLAVIKNNGYGLGVANVARVFGPMPEVAVVPS